MQTTTYFVVYPNQNFRYLARVSDIDEVEMLAQIWTIMISSHVKRLTHGQQ